MIDYPNILVVFTEAYDEGWEFERWPHHITVLPWFKANSAALTDIEKIVTSSLPLEIELTEHTAMFGAQNDIKVRLVESPALHQLHRDLLSKRAGLLGLINSRFTGADFKPHITLQGQNDPAPGQRHITQLSLVKKMAAGGKLKRVEQNLGL